MCPWILDTQHPTPGAAGEEGPEVQGEEAEAGLETFPLCVSCSDKHACLSREVAAHCQGLPHLPHPPLSGVPHSLPDPLLRDKLPFVLDCEDPPTMVSLTAFFLCGH